MAGGGVGWLKFLLENGRGGKTNWGGGMSRNGRLPYYIEVFFGDSS